jgi:hypothetical protein
LPVFPKKKYHFLFKPSCKMTILFIHHLKPSQLLTTRLQSQDLTVPDCIYFWFEMKTDLAQLLQSQIGKQAVFAKQLIECVEEREEAILNNKIALAGWFLAQKLKFTMTPQQIEEAKAVIRMVALKHLQIDRGHGDAIEVLLEETPMVEPVVLEVLSPLDQAINEAASKAREAVRLSDVEARQQNLSTKSSVQLRSLDKEITQYEQEVLATAFTTSAKPDALKYWEEKCEALPILSRIALDIVCVPMTEVTVERLFSHLNFILTKRRNRTKGSLIKDILFLRLNKKFADDDYGD